MRLNTRYVYLFAALAVVAALGAIEPSFLSHGDAAMAAVPLVGLQMTPSQARVIDPILTEVARGYKNAQMVGGTLFPTVPVDQRGGQIIEFGKEDFRLYATGRTPGANTKRVQYGYLGKPFALKQHALEGTVPFEIMQEANKVPGVDMGRVAVMRTQNIIALRLEKDQADKARDANSYAASNKITLAGNDQFNDYVNSDPSAVIEAGREAVRAKIGRRPNKALIGAPVFSKLKYHTKLIERFKFTGRDSITAEMLAQLWGFDKVEIGEAVYADNNDAFVDVWGKDIVLAFTDTSGLNDAGLPSYGYTYQLRAHPIVEVPYQDRNAKSWVYPVTDEVDPVIAGAEAGYLIKNAVL